MSGDLDRIAHFLLKEVTRAIGEFELIDEADRVAVAVSGGKDSRAMLELLLRHRRKMPYDYDLIALHVVGTEAGLPDLRPELEPWLKSLGVDHRFVPLALPPEEPLPLNCFRCSWNRRKALFTTAADLGCTRLALGHHADDAAHTALLNLFYHGRLEAIEPHRVFFGGILTVIRPLIDVPEKELVRFARACGFPTAGGCCPSRIAEKWESPN